jgi:hypothetical protein
VGWDCLSGIVPARRPIVHPQMIQEWVWSRKKMILIDKNWRTFLSIVDTTEEPVLLPLYPLQICKILYLVTATILSVNKRCWCNDVLLLFCYHYYFTLWLDWRIILSLETFSYKITIHKSGTSSEITLYYYTRLLYHQTHVHHDHCHNLRQQSQSVFCEILWLDTQTLWKYIYIKKLKLSHYTPWRRLWGEKV